MGTVTSPYHLSALNSSSTSLPIGFEDDQAFTEFKLTFPSGTSLTVPENDHPSKTLRSSKKRGVVHRHSSGSFPDSNHLDTESAVFQKFPARKSSLPQESITQSEHGSFGLSRSSGSTRLNRSSTITTTSSSSSSSTTLVAGSRTGSLPQEAVAGARNNRIALAEFRLNDIYPARQRRLLAALHRMDERLKREGVVRKLSKEQLKGKPDKDVLKPDRKSLNREHVKRNSQVGFITPKIPTFLRTKKLKKTRPVILHNVEMAIRDRRPDLALQYLGLLPPSALKKKKMRSHPDLNHCMLLALVYRMERVAIEFFERGFPADCNSPILRNTKEDVRTKGGKKKTRSFEYPSYFIVAVGLGMGNLVRAMIKNANLNQAWCGLTPLILATTLSQSTNTSCPAPTLPPAKLARIISKSEHLHLNLNSQTLVDQLPSSFNKSTTAHQSPESPSIDPPQSSPNSIVTILLEHGADPLHSITLQQYLWASRLKTMGVQRPSRRRNPATPPTGITISTNVISSTTGTSTPRNSLYVESPIEYTPRGRQNENARFSGQSFLEPKAPKAARILGAHSLGGNSHKRFSQEMQAFWTGKMIQPVEVALASGNLDCARTILHRLGPESLKSSSFGLLLQQDVMLTLSMAKLGCSVSQRDINGSTPLHLAARNGDVEMVRVLVHLGSDTNSHGERMWTPLHESFHQNHAGVSAFLIASGANPESKDVAGETPEDIGRRRGLGDAEIMEHLDTSKVRGNNNVRTYPIINRGMHVGNTAQLAPSMSFRNGTIFGRGNNDHALSSGGLRSIMLLGNERKSSLDLTRLSSRFSASTESLVDSEGSMTTICSTSSSSSSSLATSTSLTAIPRIAMTGHGRVCSFDSESTTLTTVPLESSAPLIVATTTSSPPPPPPPMPVSSNLVGGPINVAGTTEKRRVRGFLKSIFN